MTPSIYPLDKYSKEVTNDERMERGVGSDGRNIWSRLQEGFENFEEGAGIRQSNG